MQMYPGAGQTQLYHTEASDDDLDEDDRRYNSFSPMYATKGEPYAPPYQTSHNYAGYGPSLGNFNNESEGYDGQYAGYGQSFGNVKHGGEGFNGQYAGYGQTFGNVKQGGEGFNGHYAGYDRTFGNVKQGGEGFNGHYAGYDRTFGNVKQGGEGFNGHYAGYGQTFGNVKQGGEGFNGHYAGYDQTFGNYKPGGEAYNGNHIIEKGYGKESYNDTWNGGNDYCDHGGMYPNYDKYFGSFAAHNVEKSGGFGKPKAGASPNYPQQNKEIPIWKSKGITD